MKKLFFLLVAAFMLLTAGCDFSRRQDPADTAVITEQTEAVVKHPRIPMEDMIWWTKSFRGSSEEWFFDRSYTVDDRYGDEALQRAVSGIAGEYPLDSWQKVDDFAWALYDIFMENRLFDPELIPDWAEHYTEGIWKISFSPHFEETVYYDGPSATVLVSEADGHIIYFTAETLFMKEPLIQKREKNHYTAEPWESLSYIWYVADNSADRPWQFDYNPDGNCENEVVQAKAAALFADYPLDSRDAVQKFAAGFCDAMIGEGLFDSGMTPEIATHYHDGVWVFRYNNLISAQSEENALYASVFISDEDGRVIYLHTD